MRKNSACNSDRAGANWKSEQSAKKNKNSLNKYNEIEIIMLLITEDKACRKEYFFAFTEKYCFHLRRFMIRLIRIV